MQSPEELQGIINISVTMATQWESIGLGYRRLEDQIPLHGAKIAIKGQFKVIKAAHAH